MYYLKRFSVLLFSIFLLTILTGTNVYSSTDISLLVQSIEDSSGSSQTEERQDGSEESVSNKDSEIEEETFIIEDSPLPDSGHRITGRISWLKPRVLA